MRKLAQTNPQCPHENMSCVVHSDCYDCPIGVLKCEDPFSSGQKKCVRVTNGDPGN